MTVKNLRLKRGWSQKQLAENSGVSVRTIQRIEQGDKPGLESSMALASVLEVDVSTINSENEEIRLIDAENRKLEAIGFIQGIKEFYVHLAIFIFLCVGSLILWGLSRPLIVWFFFFWGAIVLVHGLISFDKAIFLGPKWEKRIVEKRLGKKL